MNDSTIEKPAADIHHDIQAWLSEASAVLHRSSWRPYLRCGGIDLLDAVITPLYIELLKFGRRPDDPTSIHRHSIRYRLLVRAYQWKQSLLLRSLARNAAPQRQVDVLFWPRHLTHVKSLGSIAASVDANGLSTGMIIDHPDVFRQATERGLEPMLAQGLWRREMRAARREGLRAAKMLETLPSVVLPPFNWVDPQADLSEVVRATLRRDLPSVYEAMCVATQVLTHLRPRVLVVGNDLTLEGRTGCLVAAGQGTPTVCPMHGTVSGNPFQGQHRADKVLVYGRRSRQELIDRGEDPQRIAVCGAPYLQGREKQSGMTDAAVSKFLNLPPHKPWMLIATSGPGHSVSHDHHCAVVDALARLSAEMPQVEFVVKLHPKDRPDFYLEALQRNPGSRLRLIPRKSPEIPSDILVWLQGCGGLLTGASTSAIEAMLLDVPVVTMDFKNEFRGIDFIESGATLHIRDYDGLRSAVETVLERGEVLGSCEVRAKAFLAEYFHDIDGDPAQKAAEVIRDLAPTELRKKYETTPG